jgi:large subunit ribosomal protein L4
MYEANRRAGTHKTKERGEVAGSSKKPWKQKHTGRARAGHKRSPLWRGGGTVFGPRPRSYYCNIPRKQRRVALASALVGKLQDGEVFVADGFPTKQPSTKAAYALLEELGAAYSTLIVTAERDDVVWRSVRNIPGVDLMALADLNAFDVVKRQNVVFTPQAFDDLMSRPWSQKRDAQDGVGQPVATGEEVNDG